MGSFKSLRHRARVRACAQFRPSEAVLPVDFSPQGVPDVQTQNIQPEGREFMGSFFQKLYVLPVRAEQVNNSSLPYVVAYYS